MLMRELVQRTGISAATLRYYEQEGLLDARFIERSSNNYRHYNESAVERVQMIKQGQSAGFTLTEIKTLMSAWDSGQLSTDEQIVYLRRKQGELARRLEELQRLQDYITDKLERLTMQQEESRRQKVG